MHFLLEVTAISDKTILLVIPELGNGFDANGEYSPKFDDTVEWDKILFGSEFTVISNEKALLLIPESVERTDDKVDGSPEFEDTVDVSKIGLLSLELA